MKRPIDKSKKSNIKCEHCEHFDKPNGNMYENCSCKKSGKPKNYWNRCKEFEWCKDASYV